MSKKIKNWLQTKGRGILATGLTASAALGIILLLCVLAGRLNDLTPQKLVQIKDCAVKVKIAKTEAEQIKGLMGEKKLAADEGMLFVYENGYFAPSFWMKNMKFPLDIIWIRDYQVVGFEQNAAPLADGDAPVYYTPATFINRVLEVPAGFVAEKQVKIGDPLVFFGD